MVKNYNQMRCKNPIIIGGSGSSGSTLLATILNRHSDIAIGPELSLFNKPVIYNESYGRFIRNLNRYIKKGVSTQGWFSYLNTFSELEKFGWDDEELIEMALSCDNIIEFIDLFFKIFLDKNKKKIWGEKTPSNSYYFDSFLNLYPKARIIHIVRDMKDVIPSFKKRGMNSYDASMLWLYNTSMALRLNQRVNYHELSYEDLVLNPEITLRSLCKFLKISYNKEMLRTSNEDNMSKIKSWGNNPSGQVRSDSIGKNRKILGPYDYFIFERIRISNAHKNKFKLKLSSIRSVNDLLGYEQEIVKYSIFSKLFYWLKLLISVVKDRIIRIVIMIWIDNKIYSFPGSIKMSGDLNEE